MVGNRACNAGVLARGSCSIVNNIAFSGWDSLVRYLKGVRMYWKVLGENIKSYDSEKRDLPLRNSYMTYMHGDMLYVAVSKGMSEGVNFRSHLGSSIAVSTAIEVMMHHSKAIITNDNPLNREFAIKNVCQGILAYWSRKALGHLRYNGFSNLEIDALTDVDKDFLSRNALLSYAGNLLVMVVSKGLVVGMSIGDFDILSLGQDDDVSILNESELSIVDKKDYNISNKDSYKYADIFEINPDEINNIIVSTSSFREFYSSVDEFKILAKEYQNIYNKKGVYKLNGELKKDLLSARKNNQKSDVTACYIYR